MSESRNDFGRKSITPKTVKRHPRVDLTAMVSVSFLLIIFFMLTSYLSKPQALDLGMPERSGCEDYGGCGGIEDNRSITLLLGKNNKIVSYMGYFDLPFENPKTLSYNKSALRNELLEKTNQVLAQTGDPKKGLIVLIKPGKNSNYGDLVNVLDEMAIVKVPTYAVVDITPEEEALLAKK